MKTEPGYQPALADLHFHPTIHQHPLITQQAHNPPTTLLAASDSNRTPQLVSVEYRI